MTFQFDCTMAVTREVISDELKFMFKSLAERIKQHKRYFFGSSLQLCKPWKYAWGRFVKNIFNFAKWIE